MGLEPVAEEGMEWLEEEEDSSKDWRQTLPSPSQIPSAKLKQMELDFGQGVRKELTCTEVKWKLGKAKTGKLSKKEMKDLARKNHKIGWKAGEEMVTEVEEQAGGEDDGGASTEPALAPQPEQTILAEGASSREDQAQVEQRLLPGNLSIQVDQEEPSEDMRIKEVTPEGKG